MQIYGVKAQVYLKYEGGIEDLSKRLKILPNVYFDTDMDPPHEVTAFCEALGFESWLEYSTEVEDFSYSFSLQTELDVDELFNDQVYDISPWLARYIARVCKIESCILNSETMSYFTFDVGHVHKK